MYSALMKTFTLNREAYRAGGVLDICERLSAVKDHICETRTDAMW